MKQYYIVSLKHTSKGDAALLFFGPNNCGYTYHRDRAGKYSYDDAIKFSGPDAPMVECEKVDPFWMNAVDFGDKFIAVANTPAVRKAIGITDKFMKPKKYAGCRMAFMNTPVLTLILFVLLASCGDSQFLHEIQYSPDGTDSVAYVWYFDGKQHYTFHMAYPQFKTLYDEGGYEAVYDYYREHELPEHTKKRYEEYRVKYPYRK